MSKLSILFLLLPALRAETLNEILARMDQSSTVFRGMTAQMVRVDYTAAIKDTSDERGTVTLRKTAKGVQGLIDNTFPDMRTLQFSGKEFRIYLPKINTIQIYDVGKRHDQVNQFLTLGFGTSGKDLLKSYDVKLLGADTLNGVKTSRLELMPRSRDAQELFQKLELWIPEGASHVIQEKVHLKGGDYKLFTYGDVKINPPLTDQALDLRAPKNAKQEYIGK